MGVTLHEQIHGASRVLCDVHRVRIPPLTQQPFFGIKFWYFFSYMNQWLFSGNPERDAGQPDYDHIVSLYAWESKYNDDEYHDDDLLTFR